MVEFILDTVGDGGRNQVDAGNPEDKMTSTYDTLLRTFWHSSCHSAAVPLVSRRDQHVGRHVHDPKTS